jgi:hypothetical protein
VISLRGPQTAPVLFVHLKKRIGHSKAGALDAFLERWLWASDFFLQPIAQGSRFGMIGIVP